MSDLSSDASSWDARYASQELVWSLEPNQFVVEYLQHLPPSKMIDLAGGEGRNALWFAQRGWQVENVEISQVALGKFLKRAEHAGLVEDCFATHADALSAEFTLQADLLVVAYLQLPAVSLAKALDNARDQLASDAMVFGVWHAKRNLTEGFGGPPMPEVLPSPDELEMWAKQNLVNYEVFELERVVEKEGSKHVAIDVILKGQLAKSQ